MVSYLRNPELKSILIKLALAQVIFACLVFMGVKYELAAMNKAVTKQNIALTGHILSKYPELENEMVRFITKQATEDEIAKGKQFLLKYGYREDIPTSSQPVLRNFDSSSPFKAAVLVFTFIFPIMTLVFLEYQRIYKKVREISLAAESVVDGDFSIVLPENREGEFGILGHNFN